MNYNQFSNLSCYEEFEIQCTLTGISKIDILKEIGHNVGNYYFFISNDGIFNWFDLNGNHVEDPCILKALNTEYIPCSISNCIIPDSVTIIGDAAFSFCKSLTSIIIPNSVTNIGNNAFSYCYLVKEITIPDSVTKIGNGAFLGCKSLEKIVISDSVISIGDAAFFYCSSLKEIVFKGKILEEVKQMNGYPLGNNYPFGIEDESIIKCKLC